MYMYKCSNTQCADYKWSTKIYIYIIIHSCICFVLRTKQKSTHVHTTSVGKLAKSNLDNYNCNIIHQLGLLKGLGAPPV